MKVNADNLNLIHCDFELDNIIWDGERAGVTAFDDIVLALGDTIGDSASRVGLQIPFFLRFIVGYRSVRPFGQEELNLLTLFMRMDKLVTYA